MHWFKRFIWRTWLAAMMITGSFTFLSLLASIIYNDYSGLLFILVLQAVFALVTYSIPHLLGAVPERQMRVPKAANSNVKMPT